ncbi:hypothetical protein BC827DRAFT_159975 [Russula dissimulans]|nr:hypothetical protein BC827DRAFT_159975 [Russula dissimulans]
MSTCHYESKQKTNLKAHLNAKHSSGRQYSCKDCSRHFTDPAARLRHQKKAHGYVPHHTAEYLARKALGEKRAVQEADEIVPNKRHCQRAPSPTTYDLPDVPSLGALPRGLLKLAHHDNFWSILVDIARSTSEQRGSQVVQHSLPSTTLPGGDAPEGLQSSLPEDSIPQATQFLSSTTPTDLTHDYSAFLDSQLDATPLQGQALTSQFTQDSSVGLAIPSDYAPYLFPSENDATILPTSGGPEIFPGMGFPIQFPDPSVYPYHDTPLFIPANNGPGSIPTPSPAFLPQLQEIFPGVGFPNQFPDPSMHPYPDIPPFEPGPGSLSPAIVNFLPQLDFLAGGPTQDPEWDAWRQLNLGL